MTSIDKPIPSDQEFALLRATMTDIVCALTLTGIKRMSPKLVVTLYKDVERGRIYEHRLLDIAPVAPVFGMSTEALASRLLTRSLQLHTVLMGAYMEGVSEGAGGGGASEHLVLMFASAHATTREVLLVQANEGTCRLGPG